MAGKRGFAALRLISSFALVPMIGTGVAAPAQAVQPDGTAHREAAPPASCRVVPGRNVQVTQSPRDGYLYEPVIAVDPGNPARLAIAALDMRPWDPARLRAVMPFYSDDGGRNWRRGVRVGGNPSSGDSGIFFDLRRRPVLYANYGAGVPNTLSHADAEGRQWRDRALSIPNLDKPTMAIDRTGGRYSGNYYFFGMSAEHDYVVRLATSRDLSSWTDLPVATAESIGSILGPDRRVTLLNTSNDVVVMPSGAVYLTFVSVSVPSSVPDAEITNEVLRYDQWFARSSDGGRTFSAPRRVSRRAGTPLMSDRANFAPAYAVDASGGVHSGRMYTLWFDVEDDHSANLFFSTSADGGDTWEDPRLIERIGTTGVEMLRRGAMEYVVPTIAVNRHGVLVMAWYRLRQEGTGRYTARVYWQRHVTASVDGGRTFLPPVPLAEVESLEGRGTPGHYMTIAPDRTGTFHTAWLDERTGKKEVWYAPVRVSCNGRPARAR